jgi:hypothetical protein
MKFDKHLNPEAAAWPGGGSSFFNQDFISPSRISNVIEEIA